MLKCFVVAAALVLASVPADEKAWAEAWARVSKALPDKDKKPEEFSDALKSLGDATYDKRDKELVNLVLNQLLMELKDDMPGGAKEEKIDGRILDACEYCLRRVSTKPAIDMILAQAKPKAPVPPRAKFYILRACGGLKAEQAAVLKVLLEVAADEKADPKVEIGANDGLAELKDRAALPHFYKVLAADNKVWEVKISALGGVKAILKPADADVVDQAAQLIEVLAKLKPIETRIKVDLIELLGVLLDVADARTDDPNWWRTALATKKSGKKPGSDGQTYVEPVEFFGLKMKSSRIVFVLDKTGSMDLPMSEADLPKRDPPKNPEKPTGDEKPNPTDEALRGKCEEIKKKHDTRKVEKRMDILKKEFINTIYNLDPRVYFSVVWYEVNQDVWKPEFVKASWPVKFELIKAVDTLNPSGGTNIWGGLEKAFEFVASPAKPDVIQVDKKGNYATVVNGADTIVLMTDGNHNNGRFSIPTPPTGDFDEGAMFAEYKKINTLRKVVVNTFILGNTTGELDPVKPKTISLFKRIAEDSGGTFVHLGK